MLVINPSGKNARRLKWSLGIFFIVLLATGFAHAAATNNIDLKAQDDSPWSETFTIRNGLGYKDNVSLSHSHPSSSPFLQLGADIEIFRIPSANGWLFTFLVSGDDWYYWEKPSIGHEDLWTAAINLRKKLNDHLTFSLLTLYAYENLVVDLSSEENFASAPTKIQGNTLVARPALKWNFGTNWWTQLQLDATRQFFDAPASSYTRFGPKLSLGYDYGHRSDIALSYEPYEQWYDTLKRTDASGTPLSGSRQDFRQRVELEDRHYWDSLHHWRNGTKFSFEYSQDNGHGFFDYYRYGLGEEMEYQTPKWDIKGSVTAVRYDYPVQTVAPPTDTRKWSKDDVLVNLRAERTLIKWAKVFAEYQYERSLSDRTISDYQANTVSAGVEWVF